MLAPPAPSGLRGPVKPQCSYYHSSCNINPHIIRHSPLLCRPLSPPKPLIPPVGRCRSRGRSAAYNGVPTPWAGESVAQTRSGRHTDVRSIGTDALGRAACRRAPRRARALTSHSLSLGALKGGRTSLTHSHTNTHKQVHAQSERSAPERQTAQTWNGELRRELFAYTVTILDICIKKELWNSLIEHAGGGIMHL